jgi:hypothetical protein
MTSREARLASPKLLPGVSAGTWARIIIWLWIVSGVFFVVGFLLHFVPAAKQAVAFPGFVLLIVAVVIALALRVVLLGGVPKSKAEACAGYTTLARKYPNLEQIDPKSGAVLRAAGDPYLPGWRQSRDIGSSQDFAAVPRPSLFKRLRPTLLGLVGGTVFVSLVNAVLAGVHSTRLTVALYAVLIILAIYAIAILIGSLVIRRTMMTLRAAAPSDFAFMFGTSAGLTPALQAILPVDQTPSPRLTKARRATASATEITFWQGDPLESVGTLPWSRVISVEQDLVSRGRYSYPSVAITFRDEEADVVVALQLVNADAKYLAIHSVSEARWIAWELNQLRTSRASARLI